jgi:LPS O-antigen subunit length determinant protein (WzzB/FepE family)
MEPGHSSKLARSDTYARWTFLQTNFLESRLAELRRISLPSTLANRDFSLVRIVDEKSTPIKRGLPKKAS